MKTDPLEFIMDLVSSHHGPLPLLAFAAAAALLAAGAARAEAEGADRPLLDFRQTVLDNGLTVLTLENFAAPVVDVQMWYHVGSKDERPDRQGFAHLFEHMMFRGTDRLGPTDHFDLLRRAGGFCNGSTGFDRTVYVQTVPAHQLELALWLEAERMAFLKIDQDSFDTERKVVEEERRLYLSGPYGGVDEKLLAQLFRVHPYRWAPIGRIPDLRQATVAELREFWRRYYVPNNAVLTIVGAVRTADAQALAEKYFGWIPRGPEVPRVAVREPRPQRGRAFTIPEDNAPAPKVALVFRAAAATHPDRLALDLLATILGRGSSSRLYRSLVAEGKLAVQAEAENESWEHDGLFRMEATLPPDGADLAKVRAALEAHVAAVREEKVSERELLKARNQLLRQRISGCLTVHGMGTALGRAATILGDANRANLELVEMRRLTGDDLLRVAREYLAPDLAYAVIIEKRRPSPSGAGAGAGFAEDDAPVTAQREEKAPPPGRPGAARPASFPQDPPLAPAGELKIDLGHVATVLPSGLKVIVVSDRRAPFVNVYLYLRRGAWAEDKPGACSLALAMLTQGTADRTEAQLADELETYAIGLRGEGRMDDAVVECSCLSEHLPRAMGLLGEVVRRPTFPADEFERLRRRVLANLEISEGNPGYQADRQMRRLLFGTHPYSRSETGEADDVKARTAEDARAWWAAHARAEEAVLVFAGDVTPDRAFELAKEALGGWRAAGESPKIELPSLPERAATRIYVVDRPGAIQSQIRVAQIGVGRKHPLYFTTRVIDGYFGRGFGARLNASLRVRQGLTYGIGGGFAPSRLSGRFAISTFTRTEATGRALRAILDEIRRLRAGAPTDEELRDTRAFLLGSFATSHEQPAQVAGDLWMLEAERLPDDWFRQMLARVPAISARECLSAAQELVDESRMTIVVAGDAARLRKDLEAIAPVTVVPASPAAPAPDRGTDERR